MSAVKDGLPIIWKQLAIRLSLFKQIVPKSFGACMESISQSILFLLFGWMEASVSSFFFLLLLKTENKLKVLYQNSLVYDDVLLRHGEIENYFIIFVVVDVVVIQFILVSNNFCCCWKCAIKMRTVLLKLHLIVSGLLMLTTWKNVHGNHIPNDKY